jgi:2-oxoglutarate ferredoxin oxidoreductase subunit delta
LALLSGVFVLESRLVVGIYAIRIMAGKITIDIEKCKGCGLCVAVCPKGSIVICEQSNAKGYYPARQANDDCTGCCNCAVVCPDAAIEVQRDDSDRIKGVGNQAKKSKASMVEDRR